MVKEFIVKFCMVQGGRSVNKDVPPYILAGENDLTYGGLNSVGLRRNGFTNEQITDLKKIYNYIYKSKYRHQQP